MLRPILLLFSLYVSISYSTRFADEIFKYDNLDLFPKRIVESIVVPRQIDDVAYISFSAEKNVNISQDGNSTMADHVGCNPIVAKVFLKGLIEIVWSTSLETGMSKSHHTSLSLSPDGKKLYVAATFLNENETEHKFQVLTINTTDGAREKSLYVSKLPGSQVIRATAVNKTGMYICGRSTSATLGKDSNLESIQSWDFLLCKISFSGSIDWQYTKNITNKTCEDVQLHDGSVYTTGNTRMNDTEVGVVYKHTGEGDLVWGRRVRSTLKLAMRSSEMLVTMDGIFVSSYLSNIRGGTKSFVQKFSRMGTLLWARELGEGVPIGIGYRTGFLYGVTGGDRDMNAGTVITRMDKYAESSGTMILNINSSVAKAPLKSRWVSISNAFLMISNTDRNTMYGVGTRDSGTVDDASTGIEEYEIRVTMGLQNADIQSVKDYMTDISHGGDVRYTRREGFIVFTIVVREASHTRFTETFKRVEASLVTQTDGKKQIERDLDIAVSVAARGFRKLDTQGSRAGGKVGTIVAICGVGFVVVVVCVWFCVSNWFSFAGEHVGMV